MDEGGSDNDTGAKVLCKVKDLLVYRKTWYSPCEDREEGDGGGGCPDDEDGTDAETGGAGTIVHGTGTLDLIGHGEIACEGTVRTGKGWC